MNLRVNKVPIYEGVACVEVVSGHGGRWWYAGAGLGLSPVLVEELRDLSMVQVRPGLQWRLAARVRGFDAWLAVNVPRTDVAALRRRGAWDAKAFPAVPFDRIQYSALPAYTGGRRSAASAVHLR